MPYYSERQRGPKPRTEEAITQDLWKGISLVTEKLYNQNYFAKSFPQQCTDNGRPYDTDYGQMRKAVEAEIKGMSWPLPSDPPEGFLPLDVIEFSFNYVAQPKQGSYHDFFAHYHLNFDVDAGRAEFVDAVNEVFGRNGSVYQLEGNGQVIRLTTAVLQETLATMTFNTGDKDLDQMLETARGKFLNPDLNVRKEALEVLWDAFERMKTVEPGKDKKAQINAILAKAGQEPTFLKTLDDEGNALTWIGNNFMIRHKETNKIPITERDHVDYLFHRMFAYTRLLLRKSGRGG